MTDTDVVWKKETSRVASSRHYEATVKGHGVSVYDTGVWLVYGVLAGAQVQVLGTVKTFGQGPSKTRLAAAQRDALTMVDELERLGIKGNRR